MKHMTKAEIEKLDKETSANMPCRYKQDETETISPNNSFRDVKRRGIKAVWIEFGREIQRYLRCLKRFSNLEAVLLHCCYGGPGGMEQYGGLKELPNLRCVNIVDSAQLNGAVLRTIAELPKLEMLTLKSQNIDLVADLQALAKAESLRAIKIDDLRCWKDETRTESDEPWVEDIRFLSEMPNLENLDVGGCKHLDLSKFVLPPRLKVITVPNYTDAATIRRFKEQCAVQIGIRIYPPRKNRFVRESWR